MIDSAGWCHCNQAQSHNEILKPRLNGASVSRFLERVGRSISFGIMQFSFSRDKLKV